jgi:transposase
MEQWAEIRRRVLNHEISKRAACDEYDIHWDTLQKILEHPEPPGYRLTKPRARPKIDPFLPIIHAILDADRQVKPKQRHTAQRIFDRLRQEHGYSGGLTIVKDAVRAWRQGQKEVFLALSHPPGEAQVDFGFADVVLDGVTIQVALFVMTLPYSDALFCQVFPRECTEVFLEGHKRGFAFFGGVPRRISYDNTKVAVAKITGSREREVTREFLRLKSHYLFADHFCLVRRPNEKGHVERLLDFARSNYLVPIPHTDRLEHLNEALREHCRQDLERQLRGKPGTKAQLLSEEQAALLPLPPQEFDARRLAQATADSLSLVRFDSNSYSVPTKYAYRQITIVAGVEEVRLVFEDRLIARHRRHWGKHHYQFDPIHYLALLERKPGGFDYARPLEGWELPECFGVLRRRLEAKLDGMGTREFIKVLRLLEQADLPELAGAVGYALGLGTPDADSVRLILEHRREQPVTLFRLDGRPHLQWVSVAPPDLSAYQPLLVGG